LPNASAVSVTSSFGSLGGGSESAQYYRVSPATSVWVLLGYTVLFLVVAGMLLRWRDIASERTARRLLRPTVNTRLLRRPEVDRDRPAGGLLAVLRSELLVMRRWPAVWAFVLVPPVYTLLNSYLVQYVFYRTAGTGVFSGLSADQILPTILPGQFVTVTLNSFGYNMGVDGTAAFILLGALVAGNDWGRGTLQTALLQGPGRLRTAFGQALAVLVAIALSVLATLVLAGLASLVVALSHSGSLSPAESPWPAVSVLVRGLAGGLLLGITYGAAGLALGCLFRSAGAAIAAALLWSVILRSLLDNLAQQLPGSLRVLDHVLPDASTTTLTQLFGSVSSIPGPPGVQVATATACWLLAGYALLFLAIPAALTRWRDIG
jgi:ABC-type transport system involved in multi-copper enzyme maturation permease subunit